MEIDQTDFFKGLNFTEYEFEYGDAKNKCFKGADGGFYRVDHFANNYVIEYAENETEARSNFFEDSELYGDDVPFDEIVNIIRHELIKMSGVT